MKKLYRKVRELSYELKYHTDVNLKATLGIKNGGRGLCQR